MVRHYYVRLDADTVRPSRTDVHAIKLLEAGVQTSCPFSINKSLTWALTEVQRIVYDEASDPHWDDGDRYVAPVDAVPEGQRLRHGHVANHRLANEAVRWRHQENRDSEQHDGTRSPYPCRRNNVVSYEWVFREEMPSSYVNFRTSVLFICMCTFSNLHFHLSSIVHTQQGAHAHAGWRKPLSGREPVHCLPGFRTEIAYIETLTMNRPAWRYKVVTLVF